MPAIRGLFVARLQKPEKGLPCNPARGRSRMAGGLPAVATWRVWRPPALPHRTPYLTARTSSPFPDRAATCLVPQVSRLQLSEADARGLSYILAGLADQKAAPDGLYVTELWEAVANAASPPARSFDAFTAKSLLKAAGELGQRPSRPLMQVRTRTGWRGCGLRLLSLPVLTHGQRKVSARAPAGPPQLGRVKGAACCIRNAVTPLFILPHPPPSSPPGRAGLRAAALPGGSQPWRAGGAGAGGLCRTPFATVTQHDQRPSTLQTTRSLVPLPTRSQRTCPGPRALYDNSRAAYACAHHLAPP